MHDHSTHHHNHNHQHHGPKNYNRLFVLGISLNLIFVIIEAIYGLLSNSLSLLADAGHNLSDVAGLLIAWAAFWLSCRKPSTRFTYGLRKSSILSVLFNAVFLLVAVGIILWEAYHRLHSPSQIVPKTVIIVASIGIIINTLTALLFFKDKNKDLNLKGAYLHMAADALISLGVVISGIIISYTSWNWLDPIVSILISLTIIYGTWGLLKDSIKLSLDAVPADINPLEVRKYLESIAGVKEAHDLHIWPMSTTETALSVHLTMKSNLLVNDLLTTISSHLKDHFNIDHPTIQLETDDPHFKCHFFPDDTL